ncbi:MAG TPA: hypothetical protein V6D46_02980 [Coleofasciculaceae cyanobacterium]
MALIGPDVPIAPFAIIRRTEHNRAIGQPSKDNRSWQNGLNGSPWIVLA